MDLSGGRDLDHPMGPPQTSGMASFSTTPTPPINIIPVGPGKSPMDEASEQSTLSHAFGGVGPPSSKRTRNEGNKNGNKSDAGRMMEEKGKSFKNEVLGNYLILKNVFQNLENNDLGSCCQVNDWWRSIAQVLYVRRYEVQLRQIRYDLSAKRSYSVKITAHATYKSQKVEYFGQSLEDASKLLREAGKVNKVAITFLPSWYSDEGEDIICSFLAKTGGYVTRFVMVQKIALSAFCKFLHLMPNLIQLDCDGFSFTDHCVDPNDERIRIRSLRIIKVGNLEEGQYLPMVRILKMAPNLEEIWYFPVILVEALVLTGMAFVVKSLVPFNLIWEGVGTETAFRTISHLGLKLKKYEFNAYPTFQLCNNTEYYSSVRRILQSSHDSLEYLSLHGTETFDFQALPHMTALKEIDFHPCLDSEGGNSGVKFFARHTELQRIFPNVSVLKFTNSNFNRPLNAYVYVEQFASWGSQIQHLKLVDVSGNILRSMRQLFPSVQHLEFYVQDCDELGVKLREIGKYWSGMESLAIRLCRVQSDLGCSFDSAFTGIPDVALNQLRDPGLREDHFPSKEIQKFKERSVLRKLSKLKILKFHLEECDTLKRSRRLLGKFCAITAVSKEFGFQFLPNLKIVLRASDWQFQEVSDELKASRLGTLVRYEVEYAESPCGRAEVDWE